VVEYVVEYVVEVVVECMVKYVVECVALFLGYLVPVKRDSHKKKRQTSLKGKRKI
jgi:hypothetical protein